MRFFIVVIRFYFPERSVWNNRHCFLEFIMQNGPYFSPDDSPLDIFFFERAPLHNQALLLFPYRFAFFPLDHFLIF